MSITYLHNQKEEDRNKERIEGKAIQSFRDLVAWQEALALVHAVYTVIKKFPKDELFALVSQMRRAAVFITSNIAEGFGRTSLKEKVQFYSITQGLITELQSQVSFAQDVQYITTEEFERLDSHAVTMHKIISGLMKSTRLRLGVGGMEQGNGIRGRGDRNTRAEVMSVNRSHLLLTSLSLLLLLLLTPFFLLPTPAHATTIIQAPVYVGLTDGLVGAWSFDGPTVSGASVADVSGNNNHGALVNSPSIAAGKVGQGIEFDGADDYVEVPDDDSFTMTDFTISYWVKPNTYNPADQSQVVAKFTSSGGNRGFLAGFETDGDYTFTTGLSTCVSNNINWIVNNSAPPVNSWVHVTWVSTDTVGAELYENGAFYDSISDSDANCTDSPGVIRIGSRGDDQEYLDGSIDDVRIYDRALTPQEIKRLYTIGAGSKIGAVPMSEGLVGYWDMDAVEGVQVFDRSGNLNHGTMTNMDPTTDHVNSKAGLGQALDFDKEDDFVNIGDTGTLQIPTEITLSSWIYLTDTPHSNRARIISKDNGGIGDQWTIAIGETFHIDFRINNSTNLSANNSVSIGTWHYVVGTYDGANRKTYLDGNLILTTPTTGSINTTGTVVLGRNDGDTTRFFPGLIDDVRIYNRALSSAEVKRLYNITQPKIATVQLDEGLVGYWDMDAVEGVQVFDRSGNLNHGTMTNMDPQEDHVNSASPALGQALEFDGSDDYITVSPTLGSDSGTVSVWSYLDDPNLIEVKFLFGHFSGAANYLTIDFNTNTSVRVYLADDFGISTSVNWRADMWDHYVLTYNSGTWRLYRNGMLADSGTYAGSISSVGDSEIGDSSGSTGPFPGKLDDVRVYNRALSAAEVKRLYNLGR